MDLSLILTAFPQKSLGSLQWTVTLASKVGKYNNQVLVVKWTGVSFPFPPRKATLIVTLVRTGCWDRPHSLGSPQLEQGSCFLLNHLRRGSVRQWLVIKMLQEAWDRIRTRTRVLHPKSTCGPRSPQMQMLIQEAKSIKCFIWKMEDLELWRKVKTRLLSRLTKIQQTVAPEENSDHLRIKREDGLRRSRRDGGTGRGVLAKRQKKNREKSSRVRKELKWVMHFDYTYFLLSKFKHLEWNGNLFTWQISPQNQLLTAETLISTSNKEAERTLCSLDRSDPSKTPLTHTEDSTHERYTR